MYKFLKDWPKDREMGWSEELSGICHDDHNWYFTQNGNLWKFPLSHNLNDSCKSGGKNGIVKKSLGHKLGDMDCIGDYLFVPVVDDGHPYIQVFHTSDLTPICRQTLTRFGKFYKKINWCAIDPVTKHLYTSDDKLGAKFDSDWSPLMVYKINFARIKKGSTNFLSYFKYYDIYDESGSALTRKYVHGGCFDDRGRLYLSNGQYTLKGGSHNYANSKGGISVFESAGGERQCMGRSALYRIASSNQSSGFKFQFDGTGEEPRGLTFWDMNGVKPAGDLCGQLHAIMIDNCGSGADDFYFKHFERNDSFQSTPRKTVKRKKGIIISSLMSDATLHEENGFRICREMICELFRKRAIEYTEVVDPHGEYLRDIIEHAFSGNPDCAYTYIICHGSVDYLGIGSDRDAVDSAIHFHALSYESLRKYYSNITCKKVFLIDSCHSGSADELQGDNIYVLCSAREDDTARYDMVLGAWATRYWCAGAGSDFLPMSADDMEADSNHNGKVTLNELRDYTNSKLDDNSKFHRCVSFPAYSNEVIFD